MTVIGLCGLAQSGKDTAARVLCEQHGFVRVAFADPLKELALRLDPWVEAPHFEHVQRLSLLVDQITWEGAKKVPDVRRFLQDLGLAVREIIGEETWVDLACQRIHSIWCHPMWEGDDPRVVVTDVRFPNEVQMIQSYWGGVVVRIDREGTAPDGHVSERPFGLEVDAIIENDDTPEVLAERVLRAAD